MPLKVTWEKNENGARIPLIVIEETIVTVTVLNDALKPPLSFWRLAAVLRHEGKDYPLSPMSAEDTTHKYAVGLPQEWFWPPPTLVISVVRPDIDTADSDVRRIPVYTGAMYLPARIALFLGSAALLYLLLLCPQIEQTRTWLDGPGGVVALGLVSLLASVRARVVAWVTHPVVAVVASVLCVVFAIALRCHVTLFANESLDEITASDKIKRGDYAIALGGWNGENREYQCENAEELSTRPDAPCVAFDPPSTFWYPFARALVGTRKEIGCNGRNNLLAIVPRDWKALGACNPRHPPPLEHLKASRAFAQNAAGMFQPTDEVSVVLQQYETPSYDLLAPSDYRKLEFPEGLHGYALRMLGDRKVREITAQVARVMLTPLPLSDGGQEGLAVLRSDWLSSTLTVGTMMAPLAKDSNQCVMAKTSAHLARVELRSSERAYRFYVEAPDFVTDFPVCWPKREGGVETGEIQFDGLWAPSSDWRLTLPDGAVPRSIRIFDSGGRYLGEAKCPGTPGGSTLSPIEIENPRAEVSTLRRSASSGDTAAWTSPPGAPPSSWAWICRSGDVPDKLFGAGIWRAERKEKGKYRATNKRTCRKYRNWQDASCADPVKGKEVRDYYEAFGPPECDRDLSVICEYPP